jgi:hypothetical protein
MRSCGDLAPRELQEFLVHLVNIPDLRSSGEARRFHRRFAAFLEGNVPDELVRQWAIRVEEEDASDLSHEERYWKYWLIPVRDAVRFIWESPDLRLRQWGVFRVMEKFLLVGDRKLATGPVLDDAEWFLGLPQAPTLFEDALIFLLRHSHFAKVCANCDCRTKYFWAPRRSQKYCSEPCAIPAQREAKNRWWAAHGSEWRRSKSAKGKDAAKRNVIRRKK